MSCRLPRRGQRRAWSSHGPSGYLECAGWLAPGVLWIDGWLTSAPRRTLTVAVVAGGERREVEAPRFSYSRPDLDAIAGAAGQILVLPAAELAGDPPRLEALEVLLQGVWYRWTLRHGLGIRPDLVTRLDQKLAGLSPEVVRQLWELLVACCERFSADLEADPLVERNLAAVKRFLPLEPEAEPEPEEVGEEEPPEDEEAEEREDEEAPEEEAPEEEEEPVRWEDYASYQAEPRRPLGLSIDRLIAVDADHLFVRGWVWDLEGIVEGLDLVTPEGGTTELLPGLPRVARPQVTEIYRPEFAELADGDHGFVGLVRVEEPSRAHRGYGFELRLRGRDPLRAGPPPCVSDPVAARDALFHALPRDGRTDLGLLRDHVHAAHETLQQRCRKRVRAARSFAFGELPEAPETSLVIPLGCRLDLLEHQLVGLADEPALCAGELILVLDAPELAADFERSAFALSRLYGLPLQGLVCERGLGYAAATSLGARQARGRLLVLMHSDVLAGDPGWLSAMAELHDSRPEIGVVGAKLLYEDGSLQHAGLELSRDLEPDGLLSVRPRLQGLPRRHPEAAQPRRVAAVSGACLMISRALYEEVGGLADVYVASDLEDVDLCLRCAEAGRETWYFPAAELHHLEGATRQPGAGWRRNPWSRLYNRWRLTERRPEDRWS
jgi:hypothetical protein